MPTKVKKICGTNNHANSPINYMLSNLNRLNVSNNKFDFVILITKFQIIFLTDGIRQCLKTDRIDLSEAL